MYLLNKAAKAALTIVNKSEELSILRPLGQIRTYAARKGTREKARRKKVKVEIKKAEFVPYSLREKASAKTVVSRRFKDDFKMLPTDNVWVSKFYKWPVYEFKDAVICHRETHHPEIYNAPLAPLHAFIELDMTGVKKNKYVDLFSRLAKIPNAFNLDENRSILVFCKTEELKEEAELAGANLVGDVDVIKKIEKGEIMLPDFDFVMAHPNILPELVCLRGLLKKKFPSMKLGTLSMDIGDMVRTFKTGIQYMAMRDNSELDYGWVDTAIGTLNMDEEHLEQNFQSLLDDIMGMRPKREGPFVTRVILKSAPSVEKFKINLDSFLKEDIKKDGYESDSDDETDQAKKT